MKITVTTRIEVHNNTGESVGVSEVTRTTRVGDNPRFLGQHAEMLCGMAAADACAGIQAQAEPRSTGLRITNLRTVQVTASEADSEVPWDSGCNLCKAFRADLEREGPMLAMLAAIGRHMQQDHDIEIIAR